MNGRGSDDHGNSNSNSNSILMAAAADAVVPEAPVAQQQRPTAAIVVLSHSYSATWVP